MSKLKSLLSMILITSSLYSSIGYTLQGNYNIDAYAGAESNIRRMKYKKNFGSKIFKDPVYTELNVFAGFKMNEYFGFEAGYEFSDIKLDAKLVRNGSVLFGSSLMDSHPGFDHITNFVNSTSSIQGFNFNLMVFFPIVPEKNINIIGSLGLGHLKSNTKCDLTEIGEKNITLDDGLNIPIQRFYQTRSKYKSYTTTIRASAGIQYLTNRNFGIRALIGFENTHRIKIQGKDRDTYKKVNEYAKFKNSITYRIGFFVPF